MLDEELKEAAADDDVIAAIAKKISREHVRSEIDLMISGSEPVKTMMHISELQLFWAVFSLPRGVEPPTPEGFERLVVCILHQNYLILGPCNHLSDENLCILEADEQKETIDVPRASKRRILLGLLLGEIKELWRPSLVLSLLLYPQDVVSNENSLHERRALLHRVENTILEMGLEKVWEVEPLVDGKIIMVYRERMDTKSAPVATRTLI